MSEILKVAVSAAEKAGVLLKSNFRGVSEIKHKSAKHLVSNRDIQCEKIILDEVEKNFPDHNILSEEVGEIPHESDYTWFIDPLDGTHNFLYGMPLYGVSIGVAYKGEPKVGVLHFPERGETLTAVAGEGAKVNGEKLTASNRTLDAACTLMDSRIFHNKEAILRNLDSFSETVFSTRMLGVASVSLAYVASGFADAYILHNTHPWDYYAGCLIVEEAGGKATDFNGLKWSINSEKLIVSNRRIHEELLKIIR